jgi:hypothetical protein
MIRTQEAGNENYCGTVAVRCPYTVIDGRGVQQNQLKRKQHFTPDGNIRFLIVPSKYMRAPILRLNVPCSHLTC